jgi:mannose-6-phosphate isomerase-like protein (cupin superfamily)
MTFFSAREYTADTAWDAQLIGSMNGITTRLHWTDKPYEWHVNDGEEILVVLDGAVDMHYRDENGECVRRMNVGDIFYADIGVEHYADPIGEARILVVENEGSQ